ncbi:hypothetical protein FDP41_011149 [Naegleria fowleri]|uniref:Serine aminopeptidase S33 domain-containing protein n=1 Tax=Naegleria fowleri TaxID=5763 RepID=A0A6A5C7Q4_NAEFO|nr:uncharacterized protein FDP41_011149 [Naegleria fowleri]KAF0983171.1 hypothetical protein FDP41_011149 [Naegleria fowleri]CAG4716683.1 unnamed protein product [Naegleria fowleri]
MLELVHRNPETKHDLTVFEFNENSTHQPVEKLIIFCHGAGGRAGQFETVCSLLSEKHKDWHLVALDQIGHGKSFSSDKTYDKEDFKFDNLYSNLEFVVNHYRNKYEKNGHSVELIIVGHSVGSGLAMKYTIKHKDIVKKLILLGTKEAAPGQSPVWILPVFALNLMRGVFSMNFKKLAYHTSTSEEIIEKESECTKNNTMFMMKSICTQLEWPTHDEIASIKTPTLVIAGETDGLTPPEKGKLVHELIEGSQFVVLENTSHNMMIERPSLVAETIEKFLT